MKIRSARVLQYEEIPFELWKRGEFSLDSESWIPDTSLSCNECHDVEDHVLKKDSVFSFLIKFRASMMGDPSKPINGAVQGYVFPDESEKYKYTPSLAEKARFESVRVNHFELKLAPEQVEELAAHLFAHRDLWKSFGMNTIDDYLITERHKPEWAQLLVQSDRKKWRHHIRDHLRRKFLSLHCSTLEKDTIKTAYDRDPGSVETLIKEIHTLGGFHGPEVNEIRRALGNKFI